MPLSPELLADDPSGSLVASAPVFYGRRLAAVLGASLAAALGLMTLLRWTGDPPAALEKAVPQPVAIDPAAKSSSADLTAPDPGDTPP